MKQTISLIFILIIFTNTLYCQQSLNNYKYVIVPKKYNFLKFEDQYQLNSLTKFLFKKEGFKTLFDTDIKPEELVKNPCLGLHSRVKSNSGLFSTKLIIELVNCKNEVVLTSIEGKSKQKDYKKAYHEALREAFNSITSLNYKYDSVKQSLSKEKAETIVEEKAVIVKKEEPVVIEEEITVKQEEPVEIVEEKVEDVPFAIVLYAQENLLGFQLVDSTPKVVYILLKSSKKDLYFLKNKNGIVYKEGEKWFAEFYKGNKLIKNELHIKF